MSGQDFLKIAGALAGGFKMPKSGGSGFKMPNFGGSGGSGRGMVNSLLSSPASKLFNTKITRKNPLNPFSNRRQEVTIGGIRTGITSGLAPGQAGYANQYYRNMVKPGKSNFKASSLFSSSATATPVTATAKPVTATATPVNVSSKVSNALSKPANASLKKKSVLQMARNKVDGIFNMVRNKIGGIQRKTRKQRSNLR
jgi:hypothetical protein